ncbi:MAG: FAD-binding oxidoreductase [Polyangiaceae bacterium]|nr:FAD-binding oxidoreductase [Polyangiaceae bacterium]
MTAAGLSYWGWGHSHKFPSNEVREGIGTQVAHMLGIIPSMRLTLPSIDKVTLPQPEISVPAELAAIAESSAEARITHTYGKNFRDQVRGFEGNFDNAPDFVVYPTNEDEVAQTLAWASRCSIAVIPFGGGTSVVSGVEPDVSSRYEGRISLDLAKLDKVLEVDTTSRAARIQAGAKGPQIEAQLSEHDLTLRHYPQSFEFSTLGGWIATRAGGHFATVYTHIDDLVQSVRMVTPAGEFVTRRLPASGAGPQPERLVMGSEGALGVITEAWMRVFSRPLSRLQASVHFNGSFDNAVEAVRTIAQAGLYPTNCRLLSAEEARLNFVTDDGSHVLILGFESNDAPRDEWMARALLICTKFGGHCPRGVMRREGRDKADGGAGSAWKAAFLEAPYLQSVLISLGYVVDTFETACTWDRFYSLHAAVTSAVTEAMNRECGGGRISVRFTHVYPDGPAPYYTFIAPGKPGKQIAQWQVIKKAASDALIDNGATITHHHAVGRLHRPWYDRERPPLFAAALRAAKRSMDPANVMNPGVLID